MIAQSQLRADAWVLEAGTGLTAEQCFLAAPHYLLEHVRDLNPTCSAYWLLRGRKGRAAGAPVPAWDLRDTPLRAPDTCRFVLYPDRALWRVIRLVEDAPNERVQVILEREQEPTLK